MEIGNSGIGKNGNGNRFLSWEWMGMGMGMVLWEWEGMATEIVLRAHLYLFARSPSTFSVCRDDRAAVSDAASTDGFLSTAPIFSHLTTPCPL